MKIISRLVGLIRSNPLERAHLGTCTKLAAGSRDHWHAGKRAATLWRQASLPASQRGFQPRDPLAMARVSSCAPPDRLHEDAVEYRVRD